MKFQKLVLTLALGLITIPTFAASYKIDPAHSFITFRIQHLGYSWMYGQFNDISGDFSWDSANPEASAITVNINPASVDTNHAERDKHIRSADMLDVSNFGEAKFESSRYSGGDSEGVLEGNLTVRGVTKPIKINVTKVGEGKDPWGGYRAGFHGTYSLSRSDFNDNYNLGAASNTIEFEITIEGIRE